MARNDLHGVVYGDELVAEVVDFINFQVQLLFNQIYFVDVVLVLSDYIVDHFVMVFLVLGCCRLFNHVNCLYFPMTSFDHFDYILIVFCYNVVDS